MVCEPGRIVYDKVPLRQHATKPSISSEGKFFRKGGLMRGVVKGKRWPAADARMNWAGPTPALNELFASNRR